MREPGRSIIMARHSVCRMQIRTSISEVAVKAAEAVMNSGLYKVYTTGKPESDYFTLFNRREYSSNTEVLFWRRYDNNLSKGDGDFTNDRNFRMSQPLGRSIAKEAVDDYLCIDGARLPETHCSRLFNYY